MHSNRFHGYAIIAIVCWSLSFVLIRLGLAYYSPFALASLRYLIAGVIFLIVVLAGKHPKPLKSDMKWFLLAGASGFAFYNITFNLGAITVDASTCSLLMATAPMVTAVFATKIFRENLRVYQWIAMAIEFSGIAVMTAIYDGVSLNRGMFWILASVLLVSIYYLVQRKLLAGNSATVTTCYSMFFGMIMLLPFIPPYFHQIISAPPAQWIYVIMLAVLASVVAYLTWNKALQAAANISSVTNYMFITPILTTLLSMIILNEYPGLPTILGGGVIMLGMIVFYFGNILRRIHQK